MLNPLSFCLYARVQGLPKLNRTPCGVRIDLIEYPSNPNRGTASTRELGDNNRLPVGRQIGKDLPYSQVLLARLAELIPCIFHLYQFKTRPFCFWALEFSVSRLRSVH